MLVPDEHIIDPWTTPLAFATEAVANGCDAASPIRASSSRGRSTTSRRSRPLGRAIVRARFVVNAAGLRGDELHRLFGFDGFTVRPRRGELIVFDKLARPLLRARSSRSRRKPPRACWSRPTVFGNVMLGPTADDIDDKAATGSTRATARRPARQGRRILPALLDEEVTAVYAGLRAATEHSDYQLLSDAGARYVCLGGIRSTGLTASMAIAEEAIEMFDVARSRPRPAARRGRSPASASHPARRERPTSVPDGRTDRLPLRAGDRGRDQRGVHGIDPGRRPRRPASPHPRPGGTLPGLLLLCRSLPVGVTGASRSIDRWLGVS